VPWWQGVWPTLGVMSDIMIMMSTLALLSWAHGLSTVQHIELPSTLTAVMNSQPAWSSGKPESRVLGVVNTRQVLATSQDRWLSSNWRAQWQHLPFSSICRDQRPVLAISSCCLSCILRTPAKCWQLRRTGGAAQAGQTNCITLSMRHMLCHSECALPGASLTVWLQ
jgi:hypothetical protein